MTTPPGLPATVLAYHPTHLRFTFHHHPEGATNHPHDPNGQPTPVVGVHQVILPAPWEFHPDPVTGQLHWHEATLAAWTGTRLEFAKADPATQREALAVGVTFNGGRWGTHYGATLAARTADGHTVLRSRAGKYAEDHLYDSLIAGTMRMTDLTDTTDDYFTTLIDEANLSDGVLAVHPTHLALRAADFGLWLGGWVDLSYTAAEVAERVPFPVTAVPLDADPAVTITDWGQVDLHALRTHLAGNALITPIAEP
jgi:hypothetical protein